MIEMTNTIDSGNQLDPLIFFCTHLHPCCMVMNLVGVLGGLVLE